MPTERAAILLAGSVKVNSSCALAINPTQIKKKIKIEVFFMIKKGYKRMPVSLVKDLDSYMVNPRAG